MNTAMRDTCERGDARADRNKCIWDRVRPLTARGPIIRVRPSTMRVLRNVSRFLILVHEATGAVRGNDTADAISGGNKVKRSREPDLVCAILTPMLLARSLSRSRPLSLSLLRSLSRSRALSLSNAGARAPRGCVTRHGVVLTDLQSLLNCQ